MGNNAVTQTALLKCSFGSAPMPLTVTSQPLVKIGGMPAATMMDNKGLTFATCTSPMHPVVASTGSPGPCLAVAQVTAPWMSASMTVKIMGKCAIHKGSTLMCNFGGQISVSMTPALTTKIG